MQRVGGLNLGWRALSWRDVHVVRNQGGRFEKVVIGGMWGQQDVLLFEGWDWMPEIGQRLPWSRDFGYWHVSSGFYVLTFLKIDCNSAGPVSWGAFAEIWCESNLLFVSAGWMWNILAGWNQIWITGLMTPQALADRETRKWPDGSDRSEIAAQLPTLQLISGTDSVPGHEDGLVDLIRAGSEERPGNVKRNCWILLEAARAKTHQTMLLSLSLLM